MNKLVVGTLLFLLVLACAVGFSLTRSDITHIIVNGFVVTVELAKTTSAWQKGLSGRPSLPYDHGMLFVFDHEDYWGFWMPQMNFPLDIIWFNADRRVVFIEQDLQPCNPQNCPVYTPNLKALYVLEVNAGFVAAHQIAFGTTFSFLPI